MGEVRQEVKHRMGRRCWGWDYSGRCIYMVTITLADRSRPVLGRLVGEGGAWRVEPSEIGRIVEECWREIPRQWPGVEVMESQVMPDHFHGIIFVKEKQKKKLGNIIGSFKSRSSSLAARGKAQDGEGGGSGSGATARAAGLWAPGYVDLICFRRGQLGKTAAYIRDNPRRLGLKRVHPELFRVARKLEVGLVRTRAGAEPGIPPWQGAETGWFEAVGNQFLLERPVILQIQCSRAFFAYKRERLPGGWRICRDAEGKPIAEKTTPEFEEKAAEAMRAGEHGAVLLSPCISHGEREIARRAFEAGHRVIVLRNKGFSALYKPGGRLFESCAAGNLLMLAPCNIAARGEAQDGGGGEGVSRGQAVVLNRIAQLLAGDGAVEIDYKGALPEGIDEAVGRAVGRPDARGRAEDFLEEGG
jgi:REP element-mobilizing transposase RayT